MGILVIALSINPRPLSALELTLSGLIMGSRVDTAGDNQNPHVIISNYIFFPVFIHFSPSFCFSCLQNTYQEKMFADLSCNESIRSPNPCSIWINYGTCLFKLVQLSRRH